MKTIFIRRYRITFSTNNMLVYDAKYAATYALIFFTRQPCMDNKYDTGTSQLSCASYSFVKPDDDFLE